MHSFKELAVYQKARLLSREEAYSFTDQWRRAARSIGAQLAEAWAKCRYPRHFASKLSDADSEQMETQHWTIVTFDDGYINREEAKRLGELAQEVGRMLDDMMRQAESFRGENSNSILKEDSASYFVASPATEELKTDYWPTVH